MNMHRENVEAFAKETKNDRVYVTVIVMTLGHKHFQVNELDGNLMIQHK